MSNSNTVVIIQDTGQIITIPVASGNVVVTGQGPQGVPGVSGFSQAQGDARYVIGGRLWTPKRSGYRGSNFDPACCTNATAPSTGRAYYFRVPIAFDDPGTPLTNIVWYQSGVGTGITSLIWGVYNLAGTQLARASDPNLATTTGLRLTPITANAGQSLIPVAGQDLVVGFLYVGTTAGTILRSGTGNAQAANYALTTGTDMLRFGQSNGTALTDLPSPLDPSSMSVVGNSWWVGLN